MIDNESQRLQLPPPAERPTAAELAGGIHARGIQCRCGASAEWSVYYTRQVDDGVLRVRICRKCGARTPTMERAI